MKKVNRQPILTGEAANLQAYRSSHITPGEANLPVLKNVVTSIHTQTIARQSPLRRQRTTHNNANFQRLSEIKTMGTAKTPVSFKTAPSAKTSVQLNGHATDALSSTQASAVQELQIAIDQLIDEAGPLKPLEIEKLETKANLLVQDIVDDFVPMIEHTLRKGLQKDMDTFLKALIKECE
ncbi:MAG: hypothetical protein JKY67_22515 [Pseudomonadales bacterium]|nr:hypothetical protein [Pseudomonadales bacterium]